MDISQGPTSKRGVPPAYIKKADDGIYVPESSKHPLDSPEAQETLKRLSSYRRQARTAQADNRVQMAIDEDFYDSIQMEPEDINELIRRGQSPVVFNAIKNVINWILGTERKSRVDYRVLPRKKKDGPAAKAKGKILKYIQDCSKGEYARSEAFGEAVLAGVGWLEFGARDTGDEPIFMRSERWRNMWFDHLGTEADQSDWRYVFREKWVELDVAQGLFPERAKALEGLAESVNSLYPYLPDDVAITDPASEFDLESELDVLGGGSFEGYRQRLKMVEMWHRVPARVQLLKMRDDETPYGALDGAIFRPDHVDHQYLVRGKYFSLNDALVMTTRLATWAGSIFLQDLLTPYNHNRFPFVPIFCYRRKRDNMPYGVVRDLRDPQSDLNKRRARSLFILSSNQLLVEEGSVNNPTVTWEEANKPDGIIVFKAGKTPPQFRKDFQAIADNMQMAQADEDFIQKISGVTDPSLGREKHDLSGKAIDSLQTQSLTSHGVVFDNYFYAHQHGGEILLSLAEQFKDKPEEIRITGDQQKDDFLEINKKTESGIENNITASKADFIVSKQDWRETLRLSMLKVLSELMSNLSQSMPEVALAMLDLVVDYMDDLPNKDELVARIRKINKQHAPDEDLTPEEKAKVKQAEQQGLQEAEMMKQLQVAMAKAQLAVKQADAMNKMGKARMDQVNGQVKQLEGFLKALEVAGLIQINPALVQAADKLIEESKAVGGGNGKQPAQPQGPGQ